MMGTWNNDFDDLYNAATKGMSNRDSDMFAHSLVGAMSPYLDPETTKRCIQIALMIHEKDLHLVRK